MDSQLKADWSFFDGLSDEELRGYIETSKKEEEVARAAVKTAAEKTLLAQCAMDRRRMAKACPSCRGTGRTEMPADGYENRIYHETCRSCGGSGKKSM